MDAGTGPAAELLSPGEAEWPPELRLPPPPPPPPPAPAPARHWTAPAPHLHLHQHPPAPVPQQQEDDPSPPCHAEGFDDQQFLGSIMGPAAQPQPQPQVAAGEQLPVKRKRGRPRKNRDGATAAVAAAPVKPVKKKDEEVVCFICFDGGNLVVCDRRGCPKVYHPACIKREESFFRCRSKWDCGWHICSSCEKAVQYMCYTCTYSVCKECIKQGKFFGVRGNKGFCDTCYGTILLIESKDHGAKVGVDFDDKNSWEYLFKLYWLDLKGKHLLTLEELISAKSCWTVPSAIGRREKQESSDELYDANNDQDDSFDISSRKRSRNSSSGKKGRKRQKGSVITARKCEISIKSAGSVPNRISVEAMGFPSDMKWASSELLEFIGHMRNGDSSYISQSDVQVLLLEYIKQNNLRDPRRKSQVICDERLSSLFRKPCVGHFEMLKLLEMHFLVKETPTANVDSQRAIDPDSAQVDDGGYYELNAKLGYDKRRKANKKIESETSNPDDYAAIDMHNINLIYMRRSLMEDLIDDAAAFSDKIAGSFVRIRISGLGQKQDMYRLVKVLGTHKVAEEYSVGKKTTDYALEILNLDRKEIITMDTISNQDFTEEECKRLRQSMKFGLITRLKVGDIYEKAKIFQSLRVKDWLENEKQKLSHLRDRASETGRRRELRECVEKLQLLNAPEERARMINEVPEVHVDPRMAPNYESAEEQDYKKAADCAINRNAPDLVFPGRNGTESKSPEYHTEKHLNASGRMNSPPTEDVAHRSGAGSIINLNNTAVDTASLPLSGPEVSDMEPEKVWHYKDPAGKVHGPFTLSQLSKWVSYFPRDLRIWLTFESEDHSLLLTEVLQKQQKYFVQTTAVTTSEKSIWTGTEQDSNKSNFVAINSSSPTGYNMVYSSALSSQPVECSGPTKEGPKLLGGTLPLRSLNDTRFLHSQVQHQVNRSTIPSSAGSYAPRDCHDEGVPKKRVGEWDNYLDHDGMLSPTILPSCKSDIEQHPDGCVIKDQLQNHLKSDSLERPAKKLDTQIDLRSQKVLVLTRQQSERDPDISLNIAVPLELKPMCQKSGSFWSSATNADIHDDLQLSIALAKPQSSSLTNHVEDSGSSSASGLPSQSGAPAYIPQRVPSLSTSNSSKIDAIMNLHKTFSPDALNESFDQHLEPKIETIVSSITRDLECESPKLETKETAMNQSGSSLANKTPDRSTSETSGSPTCKIDSLHCLKEISCLDERQIKDRDSVTEAEQVDINIMVNSASDVEGIAASDVLESLTEQGCEKYNVNGAEEEQPQVSSPIALSPWGEPSYYQGEAVDSALWGVQDDPSNDMWSMPSPTPALQPSSGPGADGKDTSGIIEEVIAGHENSIFIETSPQGEKKVEQINLSSSTGSGVPEQVKPKPSAASGPSLDGSTKTSCSKPPCLLLDGINKASGVQSSGPPTHGSTKASVWQRSNSSPDGSRKVSGWPASGSSTEGSAKSSGWQQTSTSPESRKASGWQRSGSFTQGRTKAEGWQPSVSSTEGNAKADGWQRTSLSPDGSRKSSGRHSSGRESSKVNSTCGANEDRRLSSHQATTPTGKHSSEVPKRQGNGDKDSVGWGEALGNSLEASKRQGNGDKNTANWGEALGNSLEASKRQGNGDKNTANWGEALGNSLEASKRQGNGDKNTANWGEALGNSLEASKRQGNGDKNTANWGESLGNSLEASKRQGNGDKNTVNWGEALGNNRSWHTSSGNASRGSQGSHHHDKHSHGSESHRGSSHHSRRPDHRHDHGSGGGSLRSSSRGQSQRGVCKFYANGYCRKGSTCQYLHR